MALYKDIIVKYVLVNAVLKLSYRSHVGLVSPRRNASWGYGWKRQASEMVGWCGHTE